MPQLFSMMYNNEYTVTADIVGVHLRKEGALLKKLQI